MSTTRDVTGGDLNELWRTANVALPAVSQVYAELIPDTERAEGSEDPEKYGSCHEEWTRLAAALSKALTGTQESLNDAGRALNQAVEAYAYVDGELSQAGRELSAIVDSGPEGSQDG